MNVTELIAKANQRFVDQKDEITLLERSLAEYKDAECRAMKSMGEALKLVETRDNEITALKELMREIHKYYYVGPFEDKLREATK